MNKSKLVLATLAAVAAIGLAVWAFSASSKPNVPDEPVAAGSTPNHRSPEEPVADAGATNPNP